MSNSGRRGRGLRDQLRIHQVFAEEHFWRARNPFAQPVCVDPPPNPPRLAALHCPMCATSTQLDDLTADHAPPSGGQSSLGPAITAILTCRNCNNDAGHEGAAAAIARGQAPAFTHAELAQFSAARQGLEIILAHRLILRPQAVQMTDFKAAYLLGFATLGYSWGFSPALTPVRRRIADGIEPGSDQAVGFEIAGDSALFGRSVVLEIWSPYPCTAVIGSTGAGVLFPVPGSPKVPPLALMDEVRFRQYPWPETAAHAKVNEVERAYKLGTLFHGDLCHEHTWPRPR